MKKNPSYIDRKIKERFKKMLPMYCEGEEAWAIHWNPMTNFIRPNDLYWFDFFFMPLTVNQAGIGSYSNNRFEGYMQINICTPLENNTSEDGTITDAPCFKVSDDIQKVFKRGTYFDGIRITKYQENTSALQVYEDFCFLPVRIFFMADLAN